MINRRLGWMIAFLPLLSTSAARGMPPERIEYSKAQSQALPPPAELWTRSFAQEDPNDPNSPWYDTKAAPYSVAWLQNFGNEWSINVCPLMNTQTTRQAIDELIALGLPFTRSVDWYGCGTQTQADLTWSFTKDQQTKRFTVNPTRHIRLVYDPNDNAFTSKGPLTPGYSIATTARWIVDEYPLGQTLPTVKTNWDILVNGVDFDFLPGKPSDHPSVDWQASGMGDARDVFQYPVVMHELMHVLGADHLPVNFNGVYHSSIMPGSLGTRGHGIEEYGADLWHPTDWAGTLALPLGDYIFLQGHYNGDISSTPNYPRLHTWKMDWSYDADLGGWGYGVFPFSPGLDYQYDASSYWEWAGRFCDGDQMSGISATLEQQMPGLASLHTRDYPVTIRVVDEDDLNQVIFVFNDDGTQAEYHTTSDGAYWSDGRFTPPEDINGDAWVADFNNNATSRLDEEIVGRLQLYVHEPQKTVLLPWYAHRNMECSCPSNPADSVYCCDAGCAE